MVVPGCGMHWRPAQPMFWSNGAVGVKPSRTTLIVGVVPQVMVAFQTSIRSAGNPAPSSLSVTIGSGAPFGGAVAPSASAGSSRGSVESRVTMSW